MQEENVQQPEVNQAPEKIYVSETVPAPANQPAGFFTFNLNTLLSLLLLGGLIVLYILHFGSKKESKAEIPMPVQSSGKANSVVFVNVDSLNLNYEFVKVLRRDLEATGKRLQTEVMAEQAALEKEANDFQTKIAANAITEDKAKVIYEQLMQKQQALMQKKEVYTQRVAEQEASMNMRLIDSVTHFLQRFNRQYNFDYIMGYKYGGEILVANDTLDITRSVLEALNKEYQSKQR